MTAPRPIAIVGPTASGKTALAIEVAKKVGGEIISMDSRQIYRGMDIGTAKATPAQCAEAPHFGLDLVEPTERFSAGEFGRRARAWIREIQGRGHLPILAGGTGFFLRSLTHPIFSEPPLDPARREALRDWLTRRSTPLLHRWLAELDPAAARRLREWGGRQRLLRALELPLLTGRTLEWWQKRSPAEAPAIDLAVFVLDLPRDRLDQAIAGRVDDMVAEGLLDEVQDLMNRGYTEHDPGMNATGYIELLPGLRGETSLEAGLELVRKNTRAYSRRQLTWFRNQLPPGAIWLDATRPKAELAEEIARSLHVQGVEEVNASIENGNE
jgi:tRNA dimethylallyltransferase